MTNKTKTNDLTLKFRVLSILFIGIALFWLVYAAGMLGVAQKEFRPISDSYAAYGLAQTPTMRLQLLEDLAAAVWATQPGYDQPELRERFDSEWMLIEDAVRAHRETDGPYRPVLEPELYRRMESTWYAVHYPLLSGPMPKLVTIFCVVLLLFGVVLVVMSSPPSKYL